MSYCGLYRSSVKTCQAEVLSTERESLSFAGVVNTYCETCKQDHSFNFVQSFVVTGPKVLKQLLETAKSKHWNIEKGVTTQ
jgi:hypothetical protein